MRRRHHGPIFLLVSVCIGASTACAGPAPGRLSDKTMEFLESAQVVGDDPLTFEMQLFEAVRAQALDGNVLDRQVTLDDGMTIEIGEVVPIDNQHVVIADLPQLDRPLDDAECLQLRSNSVLIGHFVICGTNEGFFPAPAHRFAKSCAEEKIEYLRDCGCGFVSPFADPPESLVLACDYSEGEAWVVRLRCQNLHRIGMANPDHPICQR